MRIELPIDNYLDQITVDLNQRKSLILTAPPGSGKTLRVPARLACELLSEKKEKKIVVLVPKRLAAIAAASRIAEENQWTLGDQVGYQVRFEQKFNTKTSLIFMTEGVFLKKMNSQDFLESIDTIIFDEFHERSSATDLAIGYCLEKQILSEDNFKLKILVMSATLNVENLKKFLNDSAFVEVKTPIYPLTIIKHKKAQRLHFDLVTCNEILTCIKEALLKSHKDILIFLPGLSEIRLLENQIHKEYPNLKTEILHGSIKLEEQNRIIKKTDYRRIILSTNIAESSLTLSSVDCVIDTGLEKKSIKSSKIGFSKLELKRISLFSAKQRAGRAARTGPGICYQMWHESDERSMNEQIEPEILKSDLLEESLLLLSLGIDDLDNFSWLTKPKKSFSAAIDCLKKWTLIDEKNHLTSFGKIVQRCPLDIEKSVLFVDLSQKGFQKNIAHLLSIIETTDFSKFLTETSYKNIDLSETGRKIFNQLMQQKVDLFFKKSETEPDENIFINTVFKTYLKFFPEKMAQKKEGFSGVSSEGRGLQFAKNIDLKNSDYFILLNGRDSSDKLTLIDFALGISKKDFEKISNQDFEMKTVYQIDLEKKQIFKIDTKCCGYFIVSSTSKSYLDERNNLSLLKKIFLENLNELIDAHTDIESIKNKIAFLKRKSFVFDLKNEDFYFEEDLNIKLFENFENNLTSIQDFFDLNLESYFLLLIPEKIKNLYLKLPKYFTTPSGKNIEINYVNESAPLISVKLQELFGLLQQPSLIHPEIKFTFELLAPNYRPTQITNQIDLFWKTSYNDVRKDLRARYPKHDWPENPIDWKPEHSKKFKQNK